MWIVRLVKMRTSPAENDSVFQSQPNLKYQKDEDSDYDHDHDDQNDDFHDDTNDDHYQPSRNLSWIFSEPSGTFHRFCFQVTTAIRLLKIKYLYPCPNANCANVSI